MHTSILFPYDDGELNQYYAVIEVEFSVYDDRIEIFDMEVVDVVGEPEDFRAQIAGEVLHQFLPSDYTEHFQQAAFEWENPGASSRLPSALEYMEQQDEWFDIGDEHGI